MKQSIIPTVQWLRLSYHSRASSSFANNIVIPRDIRHTCPSRTRTIVRTPGILLLGSLHTKRPSIDTHTAVSLSDNAYLHCRELVLDTQRYRPSSKSDNDRQLDGVPRRWKPRRLLAGERGSDAAEGPVPLVFRSKRKVLLRLYEVS